jgi:hypothetical protein
VGQLGRVGHPRRPLALAPNRTTLKRSPRAPARRPPSVRRGASQGEPKPF